MSRDCYVGIDTSNYTTSVAVADADGVIVANLKRPLPVKTGECGLRQSDATEPPAEKDLGRNGDANGE